MCECASVNLKNLDVQEREGRCAGSGEGVSEPRSRCAPGSPPGLPSLPYRAEARWLVSSCVSSRWELLADLSGDGRLGLHGRHPLWLLAVRMARAPPSRPCGCLYLRDFPNSCFVSTSVHYQNENALKCSQEIHMAKHIKIPT